MTHKFTTSTGSAGAGRRTPATDPMATLNALAQGEAMYEALLNKVRTHEARVAVMGLGYVGLPLVRLFASKGFRVIACDVDQSKVDQLNQGRSYIKSVPSAAIAKHLAAEELTATSDFKLLNKADAIFVCVPTPLTMEGKPDVSSIRATAKAIAAGLRKGQLIVLESTSYPGTTREIMKPELE